jgi:hypothetical protein
MLITVTRIIFTAKRGTKRAVSRPTDLPRMYQATPEIEQLERILNSAELATSPSLSRFLRYIVEETLAGRSQDIREFTLGVRVFERGEDFNPRLDPIVRVQARNLRARMARYYEGRGAQDPIRIELPKGGYIPVFRKLVVEPPAASVASVMPAPPPLSPVAEPRRPRYLLAAVILLAILIGIAALFLSHSQAAPRFSLA